MRLLIDTQLLLWLGEGSSRLSRQAAALLDDPAHELVFSSLSVAEVAIKRARNRPDFRIEPADFRQSLLASGFAELPLTGEHAVLVGGLPPIHKDPFDRLLLAQATAEGITLLTSDATLGRYRGPVRLV